MVVLVYQLVSNGELNKSAVINHITVHHKFGSSELVKLVNEHGIVTTYDEVLRFRKSTAKYI